ncbi:MAG: universal stress protein [Chlorobium phaeobacteroides]|nr:universal stress protein [Chlorobium phaeobacteroides]MBL6956775.1 universal stress protein [Chlorobium phaeobacteroides]
MMTGKTKTIRIHRISVALDCSPHSRASLVAAAEIAELLHAELLGIFVEDINLIRMAELPFCQEIHLHTARSEPLDTLKLERLLRLQAKEAYNIFRETALRFGVPYTFRTLRGPVTSEVLTAALESDLLALGRSGRTPVCRKGLGSTAKKAVEEARPHILLAHSDVKPDGPILVLYDGSRGSKRALETACSIASAKNTLHIFLIANTESAASRLREETASIIGDRKKKTELHVLPWTDSAMLAQCIHMTGPGLVVLSDSSEAISPESVYRLIDATNYPVLLVKGTT